MEESYDTAIINQQLVEQEANMALSSESWKWLFIQEKSGQDFFFALWRHSFKGKKWSFEKILDGLFAVYVAISEAAAGLLSMTS